MDASRRAMLGGFAATATAAVTTRTGFASAPDPWSEAFNFRFFGPGFTEAVNRARAAGALPGQVSAILFPAPSNRDDPGWPRLVFEPGSPINGASAVKTW